MKKKKIILPILLLILLISSFSLLASEEDDKSVTSLGYDDQALESLDQSPPVAPVPSKYDRQVVLNFTNIFHMVCELQRKASCRKINLTTKTINVAQEYDLAPLAELTPGSRLYIIGHGRPGGDYLVNKSRNADCRFHYNQISDLIAANALNLHNTVAPITISLIACHGALGSHLQIGEEDSFGVKISKALFARGIWARIHARAGTVSEDLESQQFRKLVNHNHHEDGFKVVIETSMDGTTHVTPVIYKKEE